MAQEPADPEEGVKEDSRTSSSEPAWRRAMCRMQTEQRKRRMLPQGSIALFNFSDLAQEVLVRTCRPSVSRAAGKPKEEGAASKTSKQVTFESDTASKAEVPQSEELYTLFNFVEGAEPPAPFATFKDGFMHVARVVKDHPQFRLGLLLKDIDPKGRFPFLKYEVFVIKDGDGGIRHDPGWLRVIREGFGERQIHHQAGFAEVESLWMVQTIEGDWHARMPVGDDTVFILTVFKADGDLDRLEKKWRRWSGADYILCSMPKDLRVCIRRITFYRRVVPKGSFMYVLLCELTSVRSLLYKVKDFVMKLNHRQCGYSAAYIVEDNYSV